MNRSELLIACMGRDNFAPPRAVYEVTRDTGDVLSHVEAYAKHVDVGEVSVDVWGIAQVCTDPDWRSLGLARSLVRTAHKDARDQGFQFAALFSAYETFYAPLGYRKTGTHPDSFLTCQLGDHPWPDGLISPGPSW